jgi:hypothetical protein
MSGKMSLQSRSRKGATLKENTLQANAPMNGGASQPFRTPRHLVQFLQRRVVTLREGGETLGRVVNRPSCQDADGL